MKKLFAGILFFLATVTFFSASVSAKEIAYEGSEEDIRIFLSHYEKLYRDHPREWQSFLNVFQDHGDGYMGVTEYWNREMTSFRNAEDRTLRITYTEQPIENEREAAIIAEDLDYYYGFSITCYTSDYKKYYAHYRMDERNVYTVKEILRDCGIDDPQKIALMKLTYCGDQVIEVTSSMPAAYIPGWNEIDGERYYIKSDGTVLTKPAVIDGIRYKFGKDGVCQGKYTGKVKSGNSVICYRNGVKQEDELFRGWFKAGGKRFYAKDGVIRTGWVTVGSKRYYIDPKEGRLPGAERICVKVPDGTVYESADGGKSWTVDGKKTERPTLSARFEEKRPAVFSEKSVLTIRNETGKEIDFGEVYELFREENGKWIPAEMIGEWFSEDVLCILESGSERTTDVHTEIHAPIKGKYRYTVNLNDAEGNGYMISVEFWAVEE